MIAAGIDDALFWRLTPHETRKLINALAERYRVNQHNANYRAGLIAAILRNIHSKKGAPTVSPMDFFREPTTERMTIEEAQTFMRQLARRN